MVNDKGGEDLTASPNYLGWHQNIPYRGRIQSTPGGISYYREDLDFVPLTGVFSLIPGRGRIGVPPSSEFRDRIMALSIFFNILNFCETCFRSNLPLTGLEAED